MGIDIGGSGIKGALVDTRTGELASERLRIPTPRAGGPKATVAVLCELIGRLDWHGPVGIGFPGVIRRNVIHTAANLDKAHIGLDLAAALAGCGAGPVRVLNDADAAGIAEMRLGAGRPHARAGTVLLLTVGTGIGTAMFTDGVLVPNLELGHVEYRGHHAESYVSERARKQLDLSWKRWTLRFSGFLAYLEFLLQPDFIILGGGGLKRPDKIREHIAIATPWAFAEFGNRAGIIGAALAALA